MSRYFLGKFIIISVLHLGPIPQLPHQRTMRREAKVTVILCPSLCLNSISSEQVTRYIALGMPYLFLSFYASSTFQLNAPPSTASSGRMRNSGD